MLHADKNDLQTQIKLHLLQIEERELVYFTENSYNIGTQAALLSGFAYAALMQAAQIASDMPPAMQGAWATFTILSMQPCAGHKVAVKVESAVPRPGAAASTAPRWWVRERSTSVNLHSCRRRWP